LSRVPATLGAVRISVLAALLLGCAATSPRPVPKEDPMTTTPAADPKDTASVDPPARELAVPGHVVAFTTDGGEPSLVSVGGQLRGYARTGRAADAQAIELRFAERVERIPLLADGLEFAAGAAVRIVPIYARGEREWFSIIESPPASADPSAGAPWHVRLLERSGGRGKLLAEHDSYAHRHGTQIRYPYAETGQVAIVQLGASLYAVAGGRLLVLDGPGADAGKFAEKSDPDCPPGKRCYMLPAEVDLKQFIGHAPSGRSFLIGGEGDIHRHDSATGKVSKTRYHNFFYTGLAEEDAVILANAGEPPTVKRWAPAKPSPPSSSPVPPLPRGSGRAATTDIGPQASDGELLTSGPVYVQLAKSSDGTLYGVTREGSLDRIADGRSTPVVRLPAGYRVVSVAAADTLAFVVVSDASPPVYSVVIPERKRR
jgi:hypothetical protein